MKNLLERSLKATLFVPFCLLFCISAVIPQAYAQISETQEAYFGNNLLINGDAELGPLSEELFTYNLPVGWSNPSGQIRIASYETAIAGLDLSDLTENGPPVRGDNLFVGFLNNSSINQRIDLSEIGDLIDQGRVVAEISGWFGGADDMDDYSRLTVRQRSATSSLVSTVRMGSEYVPDRNGLTMLQLDTREIQLRENVRELDMTLAANQGGAIDEMQVILRLQDPEEPVQDGELPDLVVSAIDGPDFAFSGSVIELSWEVTNAGDYPTTATNWIDAIVLNGREIRTEENVSYLEPGESYTNTVEIELPLNLNSQSYIEVRANRNRRQSETNFNNNLSDRLDIAVEITPHADLQVTEIIVPPTVFSGDTISVGYTVENKGNGPTNVGSWYDSFFLSDNNELTFSFFGPTGASVQVDDRFLGNTPHEGFLQPGESYTAFADVVVPVDAAGNYHMLVFADTRGGNVQSYRGEVFEGNNELNNWLTVPIEIILTPPPDLVVTDIDASQSLTSGSRYEVSWEVENQGPGAVRISSWTDAVFISGSEEFDEEQAQIVGSSIVNTFSQRLGPDTSYTSATRIRLPDGIEGQYYVHVYTDYNEQVFENQFDDNNVMTVGPVNISLRPYPNLSVLAVDVDDDARSGSRLRVDWTVENTGNDEMPESRRDKIYFSTTDVFNPETAVEAGIFTAPNALQPGESRRHSQLFRIPSSVSGDNYVFVVANADSSVFEFPNYDENTGRSEQIFVVEYPTVDLTVRNLSHTEDFNSGDTINVSWEIANLGDGRTLSEGWKEQVFLSTRNDGVYDEGSDVLLSEVERNRALAGNDSYTRNRQIRVPDGIQGLYYLVVRIQEIPGSPTGDENTVNQFALSDERIPVQRTPSADLAIVNTVLPDSAGAGEIITIEWTVENTGAGTTRSGGWYDAVYVTDQPDRNQNRIGRALHTEAFDGSLLPEESYTASATIELPRVASGTIYVVVITDVRADEFEDGAIENNRQNLPVQIFPVPPSDLIVRDVEIPEDGRSGEEITVTWTLENIGENPARGTVRDGVYITESAQITSGAALLGVLERDIELDPGEIAKVMFKGNLADVVQADSEGNITEVLPGLNPGNYHVGVRTNLRNTIRETDRSNNTAFAPGQISVTRQELSSGAPASIQLSSGMSRYYAFDVPDGEDVTFSLTSDYEGVASARLYVKRGEVPTRNNFDERSIEPFTVNHEITMSSVQGGEYFVLVQLDNAESEELDFQVEARILEFEIASLIPDYGGNIGIATTYINGAKFLEGSSVFLEDEDGNRLQAYEAFVRSSTQILARFDLKGQATGLRDMIVVGPDSAETRYRNSYTIVDGVEREPTVMVLNYPTSIREQDDYDLEIRITNTGSNNLMDYFLLHETEAIQTISNSGELIGVDNLIKESDFPEFLEMPARIHPFYETARSGANEFGGRHKYHVTPYWIYEIPPGATLRFKVRMKHNMLPDDPARGMGFFNHRPVMVRMPDSEFRETGAFEHIETSYGFKIMQHLYEQVVEKLIAQSEVGDDGVMMRLNNQHNPEEEVRGLVRIFAEGGMPGYGAAGGAAGFLVGAGIVVLVYSNPATATIATGAALGSMVGGVIGAMIDARNTRDAAIDAGQNIIRNNLDLGADFNRNHYPQTRVVGSRDPNDIIGPDGFGDEQWIGNQVSHRYMIRYENDPELANAPAQVVHIVQDLDETLDIRAFRLGSFGFGDTTFSPPPNVSFFSDRLDVRDRYDVYVDITAGIDVNAGQAFWLLRSIDPATGDLTRDPLGGFLPVNDSTRIGEGFVTYDIRINPSAQTGDRIDAEASIVFDNNPPIITPPIFNTVDADEPSSELIVSPVEGEDNLIELIWDGFDIGAGLGTVDLLVSRDGGSYETLARNFTEESYLFEGEIDKEYRFIVVASDFAGNREAMKDQPDAVVTIGTSVETDDIPETFALRQNYPNPFNPTTTIPFDLASDGQVTMQVFNVLGQRVMSANLGNYQAGRYHQNIDMTRFASGVYFVELTVKSDGSEVFRSVKPMTLIK